MASLKRSWKLQELVAHSASVNCLALGRKSGRVMVTGGDDKKVNLWAVGKERCFMSLSGHTSPVECVQFNHVEELVCSGSSVGTLKVWDLENLKLIRTLNGHRDAIKCIDFHPYEEFLASGSADCSIKFWDSRKKGCLFTYPGHDLTVNSVKFSPDGNWIASCSEDSNIKIWDIRIGRVLKEFDDHKTSVTCLEFHPHEFLLASSGEDRTVNFYDLENFQLVSREHNLGTIRSICFHPEGECLFTGMRDCLKVVGWEPNRIYDVVPVNWGRVCDISTASNQLIGASFHLTNVTVYVVDLKKIKPLCNTASDLPGPFTPNQSIRKSFSKAERPTGLRNKTTLDVKTIEESTSGTDPEEESTADITNLKDYNEIFKGRRELTRTPPLEPEPFKEPEECDYLDPSKPQILGVAPTENLEALSLDNDINYRSLPTTVVSPPYSRSKSNLDQVYSNKNLRQDRENLLNANKRLTVGGKTGLQRQSSYKENSERIARNNISHSRSDASLNKNAVASKLLNNKRNLFTPKNNSSPNIAKSIDTKNNDKPVPVKAIPIIMNTTKFATKDSPDESPVSDEYLPNELDKPAGLALEEFLPKNYQSYDNKQMPEMSEVEVLGVLERGHESMMSILNTRNRNLKLVYAQFRSKDLKSAIETAINLSDSSIIVDLLGIINNKGSLWNLDICVILLPQIEDIMQSKYEKYVTTACNSITLILRHFGPVIKTNVHGPAGSFGVDISREERYKKSIICHQSLVKIRSFLTKKRNSSKGSLGNLFKEVEMLMTNTLD